MQLPFDSQKIGHKIGYQFHDSELLKQALTHRSLGASNNERLEFLGDSILNFTIAKNLYLKFPTAKEGDLSRLRATLVKGETLAQLAKEMQLGEDLFLGEGELKSGGFRRASILADAVEAIIGAIYLEAGMEVTMTQVERWFEARLKAVSLSADARDAKSQLQEWLQARKLDLPTYTVKDIEGQAHNQSFTVNCHVNADIEPTEGHASSRKQAEKLAAEKMLAQLKRST